MYPWNGLQQVIKVAFWKPFVTGVYFFVPRSRRFPVCGPPNLFGDQAPKLASSRHVVPSFADTKKEVGRIVTRFQGCSSKRRSKDFQGSARQWSVVKTPVTASTSTTQPRYSPLLSHLGPSIRVVYPKVFCSKEASRKVWPKNPLRCANSVGIDAHFAYGVERLFV